MKTLVVENICKTFDGLKAVEGVTFALQGGQLFGLLGPNGAGKTTTMRMILNIILPDAGTIHLFSEPFQEKHKHMIGYLPEERGLYPKMRLLDHLRFLGEMKGMPAREARQTALFWLERFDLLEQAKQKIQELSRGLQQQAQFIGTVMHNPRLLIVDEPFSGLDPLNTKFLKDILLEIKRSGATIILSTHLMDQAERLCDDICLMNHGRMVLRGKLPEVKRQYSHHSVLVEYFGNAAQITALPFVKSVNDYGNYMEVYLQEHGSPRQLFQALAALNIDIRRFEIAETPLNQIFIDLVGRAGDA